MSRVSQNRRRRRLPGLDLNTSPQLGIQCSEEKICGNTDSEKRAKAREVSSKAESTIRN